MHRKFFFRKETCRTIYTDDFSKILKEMDYSVQRLQFLDLTDATENDQSLIERVLFSSSQVLEVPWYTGRSNCEEDQTEQEWRSPSYISDVEPRQDLQSDQVPSSVQNEDNKHEQCSREEELEDGSQTEPQEQTPSQDQIPRQGGIFTAHPPTSLPHQAQPMFQMYQMVPSLSNVYVSNVTANVNVHAPYVPPIPAHYGHQMPPQQQQQQSPQQMYPHTSPEGEQGNRSRRQRQKTEKKRDGPFVQANEVMSPSLENHPPPQFPNIHPMQPYYIPGAPGGPVYMQHAVLPVYPSPMFSPYTHPPGPLVYPQTNSMEPSNEEYPENVQQNFHQGGPDMVVLNCGIRQENTSERRELENNETNQYQMEEQQEQIMQNGTQPKAVSENVQFNVETVENHQIEQPYVPHSNADLADKSGKPDSEAMKNIYRDGKEQNSEVGKVENSNQTVHLSNSNSKKTDSTCFHVDAVKSLMKPNSETDVSPDVNNVDSLSVNSNSSAAGWVNEETGGQGSVSQNGTSKPNLSTKNNNYVEVTKVKNVRESPVPVSQNNEFPLIGQSIKSNRQAPPPSSLTSVVSPELASKAETPSAPQGNQMTPSSSGKSWASLFNRPDQFNMTPMSDNRGRPLARVLPYHEVENSSSGLIAAPPSTPVSSSPVKSERISSAKANGPLSKGTIPNSNLVNDPYLHNLGVFLCNYELEHKIVSLQPRGLTNRSNWCYVNAILQALIACPPFYNLLKALPVGVSKKGNKQTLIMDALVEYANEFSLLPANARIGKREKSARNKEESNVVEILTGPAFEPTGIYKILDKVRGESSFNVEGRQEDAEEFLSCLLNGLNDEMFELMKAVDVSKLGLSNGETNGSLEGSVEEDEMEWNVMGPKNKSSVTRRAVCGKTPISDIFRGQFRSRVQRAGDQSTDTVQPFFTLQLDIEKASSVKDALELFMGRDPLEGVTCSRTHQEVEAWTQTTLEDLPLVLILHLKCYDYKSDACSKIIKSVDFQVDLKIDAKLLSNRNKYTGKQRNYKLVAVVYHDGKEASKGHYVTDAYHVGYGCWLRYDDVVVRSVPESHVLKPRAPRVPYLLYYRRADTIGPTK